MSRENEQPTAAFALSLIAAILILLGGLFGTMIGMFGFAGMMGGFLGMGGMMGGAGGMMGFGGPGGLGFMMGFGLVGLVSGLVILYSAIMLNSKPAQASTWGTLILIFSLLALFGGAMGGFGLGSLLGIIGGILALTWKPSAK